MAAELPASEVLSVRGEDAEREFVIKFQKNMSAFSFRLRYPYIIE